MLHWIRIALAVGLIAFTIGYVQRVERQGWKNPRTGDQSCGQVAEAVKAWSVTGRQRRPEHLEGLERWARENPGEVNTPRGAFCWTPLHAAARFGREDLAGILLQRGAQVDSRAENQDTPLHLAARYGKADVARLLVDHGAEVNALGGSRATPLHAAVVGVHVEAEDLAGRLQVAEMLLAHDADVNARDGSGWTPLHCAAANRMTVDPEAPRPMADLLLAHGAVVEAPDLQGTTPLHEAAFRGDRALVLQLLEHGADPNVTSRFTTPLGSAAQKGSVEVVELLLQHHADPKQPCPGSPMGWDGVPLAMALLTARDEDPREREQRLRVAEMLLAHGAEVDRRNERGETLLHLAASAGEGSRVELLLSHGADAMAADAAGTTPLHRAVEHGHLEVARRLLEAGADPGAPATAGTTPRELAAGDPEMEALFGGRAEH